LKHINFNKQKKGMKNTIKEALKNKYKNMGFGDKAFDGAAEYLATLIENDTEVETAVAGVENLLKAFQADSDKVRTEKTNLEKKLAELEGKNPDAASAAAAAEAAKKAAADETPAWAKSIIDQNKELAAKLAAIEGDKVANTRKQQLTVAMEKAPAKLRERYEKDLSRMNFESDEAYAEWLTEVKTDTEAFVAEATQRGAVFGRPMGTGGGTTPEKPTPEVEARIKAREAETAAPAILGLPK